MKKLLILEVISRGDIFHFRYDLFRSLGYDIFYLTSTQDLAEYPFAGCRITTSRDIDEFVATASDWHDAERFDAILTTDEASVIATAIVSRHLGLPGLDVDAARCSRNKLLMREAHARGGAPHPKFVRCDTLDVALAFAQDVGYPVVIKPTLGGDSEHVYRVSNEAEMRIRFPMAHDGNATHSHRFAEAECPEIGPHTLIAEQYLSGSEHCVEAAVFDDRVIVGSIADRLSVELDTFDHDLYKTPTDLDASQIELLTAAIEQGVRAQGIRRGVLHAELRFEEGKPYILEIAARPGGGSLQHMARLSYGYCPITAALQVAENRMPEATSLQVTGQVAVGLTMLSAGGRLKHVEIPEGILPHPKIFNFRILPRVGSMIVRPPHGNDIFGYLGATGDTLEEALAIADHTFGQISIDLEPATSQPNVAIG